MSTFVFDGDDTLWDVEYLYSQCYADFLSFIYKALGRYVPNLHFVYQVFFDNEDKNIKTWGVRRGRVAQSMIETYRQICDWVKEYSGADLYQESHETELRRIGDQPFDVSKHRWIPGAEEVLYALRREGHTLCLLSKYDRTVWPEKAEILDTGRFFETETIQLVDHRKRPEDFEDLLLRVDRTNSPAFTVGNGEGDMVPVSADTGERWHGFYVPIVSSSPTEKDTRPTERGFNPKQIVHSRIKTLRSIRDIFHHRDLFKN